MNELSSISDAWLREHIKLRVLMASEMLVDLKMLVDELERREGIKK